MAYVGGEESPQEGCFLCRAAGPEAESSLVVERAGATVTLLNRFPYSSGHVMVVPIRHAADVLELDEGEGAALFAGVQRSLRAIRAALHPEGFNIGINLGAAAGASVEHVHVHVVPRWGGDTNFMPVVGDVKVLPEHLDATAVKLREAYSEFESE
jgi:ATP adenylyltransferase